MNQFGLSRDVPADVRRAVRQDCGFACVICGRLGQHYDHFNPEFRDATAHDPSGIALLCPTCHQDKTSGRLSNEQVQRARGKAREKWQDPPWRSNFTGGIARLRFGSNILASRSVGFSIGPLDILRITASDDAIEPWQLAGILIFGSDEIVRFQDNEVIACSGNWDVELSGKTLRFRRGNGDVVLQLGLSPHEIALERLDLKWPSGFELKIAADGELRLNNLAHTEFKNRGTDWHFRTNKVLDVAVAGPKGGSMIHFGSGHTINDFSVTNCVMVSRSGVADFNSLVNIDRFLSADMLEMPEIGGPT